MHHPNVIQLYDYAESETSYALIMEYANKASYLEEKLIDVNYDVICSDSSLSKMKGKSDILRIKFSWLYNMSILRALFTVI